MRQATKAKDPTVSVDLGGLRDPDGRRSLEAATAAAGALLAHVLGTFADQRALAGQGVTASELDSIGSDAVQRMLNACGAELGKRHSPGAALLRSVIATRAETARAARGRRAGVTVQNLLPAELTVETEAVYDRDGRMTGTRTRKALVR